MKLIVSNCGFKVTKISVFYSLSSFRLQSNKFFTITNGFYCKEKQTSYFFCLSFFFKYFTSLIINISVKFKIVILKM